MKTLHPLVLAVALTFAVSAHADTPHTQTDLAAQRSACILLEEHHLGHSSNSLRPLDRGSVGINSWELCA